MIPSTEDFFYYYSVFNPSGVLLLLLHLLYPIIDIIKIGMSQSCLGIDSFFRLQMEHLLQAIIII